MARKHKKHEEAEEGWITSYADLMTNLFAFFLMLFILATQDTKKESSMSVMLEEIRTGFVATTDKKAAKAIKEAKQQPPAVPIEDKKKADLAKKVEKIVIEQKLKDYVQIIIEEKKIRIVFTDAVIFKSGSADLNPRSKKILKDISAILKPIPNPIFIEGHTDTVPIHTSKFESNWELSFARAYSIIRYLQKTEKIQPERLSGTGYGEFKPLAPNDTAINKAKNRRIEMNIIFLDIKKPEKDASGKKPATEGSEEKTTVKH